jgi:hypothetical protein
MSLFRSLSSLIPVTPPVSACAPKPASSTKSTPWRIGSERERSVRKTTEALSAPMSRGSRSA